MSGSSSSTRSTQATNNTSLSQGIQGDNTGVVLNGDGNSIQMTDMGAIDGALNVANQMTNGALDAVNYAVDSNASLVGQSLDNANQMAQHNAELAQNAMNNGAELADSVIDAGADMLSMSLDASGQALNTSALLMDSALSRAAGLIGNQQEANIDVMMAVSENSLNAVNSGNELSFALAELNTGIADNAINSGNQLALSLTQETNDAMSEQSEGTFNALNNGFKSMMQFAENASRSDGSMVAKSANNTLMIGVCVVGLVGVAYFWSKKK